MNFPSSTDPSAAAAFRRASRPFASPTFDTPLSQSLPSFPLTVSPDLPPVQEPEPYSLDFNRLSTAFERNTNHPTHPLPVSRSSSSSSLHTPHNRFLFYSESTGIIRSPSFSQLNLSRYDQPIQQLLEQSPFWLDVFQPTSQELDTISSAFGLHPLTTEDIQTPDTREKCQTINNYFFIVIHSFVQNDQSPDHMSPIPVYIIIFKEAIVSVHFSITNHSNTVLSRIEQLATYGIHITSDWISYALIDDIIDSYIMPARYIELEVDSIDDLVLILKESEQTDMLRRIGHARKRVNQLIRLLAPKPDLVKTVIHRYMHRLAPDSETRLYLEDIHDHVMTLLQNLVHYENTVSRAHSNYLAQISIEITQASNRTSDVVMRMTALASILVPLNVVTGLWGMNVPVPGQGSEPGDLRWFFMICFLMFLIALMTFIAIRRAKLV